METTVKDDQRWRRRPPTTVPELTISPRYDRNLIIFISTTEHNWHRRRLGGQPGHVLIGVNPGGRDVPDIGQGVVASWESQVGWQGGRGRVVKYYILSCTGSMFKSGDF